MFQHWKTHLQCIWHDIVLHFYIFKPLWNKKRSPLYPPQTLSDMSHPNLETVWSGTVSLCSLRRIWHGAWHNITPLQQSDNRLARLSTALCFREIIKNIIHFFFSINLLTWHVRDLSLCTTVSKRGLEELLLRIHSEWHHLLLCLSVSVAVVTSLGARQRSSLFHSFSAWR